MTNKNGENENDNEDDFDEVYTGIWNGEEDVCESCEHDECSWHPESSMFLCDLCAPWVGISLRRTEQIPYGVLEITQRSPDVFQEIRNLITDNASTKRREGHWFSGRVPQPRNEEGWLEFLQWILGKTDELERVKTAIEMRESTIGTSESVTGIRHQIINQCEIGDDTIIEDGWGTWVNGVLFGPDAHDMHFHNTAILPQLLFDRYHGLDHRPIEEMAYAYQKGPWLNQIRETTSARIPTTPALRELVTRIANGDLGNIAAERFHAASVIWAVHVEREFQTCPRVPWAASFRGVHQIARENEGRVRFEDDGIYIDATSKNLYRIAPTNDRSDGFEVRQYARLDNDRTPPICIHTSGDPHELEMPMGDIIASLVLALLDDIESSAHIHTLRRHITPDLLPSERPGWGDERVRRRAMRRRALRDARRARFEGYLPWGDYFGEEE